MSPHSILSWTWRPPVFLRLCLVLFILFFSGCVATPPKGMPPASRSSQGTLAEPEKATLTNIIVETLDEATVVQIVATQPLKYVSYMLDKHQRLALEIEEALSSLAEKNIPFQKGMVEKVILNDFFKTGVMRLEVQLNAPADYDVKMEDRLISISFTPRKNPTAPQVPSQQLQLQQKEIEIYHLKSEITNLYEKIAELKAQLERTSVLLEPEPVKAELSGALKTPDLLKYLRGWVTVWQDKDLEGYGRFYADTFTHEAQNKILWLEEKDEKFSKAGKINVEMKNPQVYIDGNWATVKFIQIYRSDNYKDVGEKVLTMKNEGGDWKIQSETWVPIEDFTR